MEQEKAFYCKNGKVAHSLEDLSEILRDMPPDEFSHHVTPFKNDFSNWILHVLQNPELAGTVRKCNAKEETLAAIKEHMMRKEVSKRFEEYIGGDAAGEAMVQKADQVYFPPVEEKKPIVETVAEKKDEEKKGIEESSHQQKEADHKEEPKKDVVRKDVYKYFTLKEFILGVLLGFVLGFVVSKLLFSLVLS